MDLYRCNCEDRRVGIKASDYAHASDEDKARPHLILYHLSDHPESDLLEFLPKLRKTPQTFALCFKGSMFAGLAHKRDLLKQYQDEFAPRLHFLSAAMPVNGPSGTLLVRIQNFGRHARAATKHIDWTLVDPQIPENLLAAYLAMKALAASEPGSAIVRDLKESPIFKRIIREAEQEYLLMQDVGETLGWTLVEQSRAAGVAEKIWKQLQLCKI